MNRVHSIALLLILVVAPMFPLLMVQPSNANPTTSLDDISEEILDVGIPDTSPEGDVELNMMFFTETPSSDDGLYYVCRRGTDSLAYFGASMVMYISGGIEFTLEFPGSNEVIPQGESPTGSVTNYFLGNDQSEWKTGIEDCAVLKYSDIYPGIDLEYKILNGNLKYEFVVSPHADPELIRLQYADVDSIDITDDGLVVTREGQQMADTALKVFQNGGAINVGCTFSLDESNSIIFNLDEYDCSEELVIDPLVVYSSYFGGSDDDYGTSVSVENGFAYVTGYTEDMFMDHDCFVFKSATNGQSLIYSSYFGGANDDYAYGIAAEDGYTYITGQTYSADFPIVNANDTTFNNGDVFLTKFGVDGQSLVFSTFLGGSSSEYGYGIAVESGCAYITGTTVSTDFPTTPNALNSSKSSAWDCFVTKFAADGQSHVFSTYFGGTGTNDIANSIAVEDGYSYITGTTNSGDLPTTIDAYDEILNGSDDTFVTKLSSDGETLVYSTYIGGSGFEEGHSIAVENSYAYITGRTTSTDFPLVNAFDSVRSVDEGFVTKLAMNGSSLVYSTYLGGAGADYGYGIAVEDGFAYITGGTSSSDFPTNGSTSTLGAHDCFITVFDFDGTSLIYSAFLGGSDSDNGQSIAVEHGYVFITGETRSTDFCTTFDTFNMTYNGGIYDCFIIGMLFDADMDGLSDMQEALIGTNPLSIDSDFDNYLDGYEVVYGSDPLDPMSFPEIPQAWYDAIYENLDGNATLVHYLISWSAGNTSLLETVMQQLDDNSTFLTQVITWLDGDHPAIETLLTQLEGNATLLLNTVNALNMNATLIQNLLTWSDGNATLLQSVMQQLDDNAMLLTQVISWIDGTHLAIETLFTYVEGNATLLLETVDALDGNTTRLNLVAALATDNTEWLQSFNSTAIGNITEIREILDQLGVSIGDSDYDQLDDLDEISYGTDLLCVDTDDDSYLDGYEVEHGTDPLNPNDYPGIVTSTTTTETTTSTDTTTSTTSPSPVEESPLVMIIAIALGGIGLVIVVVVIAFTKMRSKN